MVGTGILALPATLKQGGWAAAGLIVLCAAMANYTGKILVARPSQTASRSMRRPRLTSSANA